MTAPSRPALRGSIGRPTRATKRRCISMTRSPRNPASWSIAAASFPDRHSHVTDIGEVSLIDVEIVRRVAPGFQIFLPRLAAGLENLQLGPLVGGQIGDQ